jgi:regulator of PEP synthase PpsR (kinase-PPPase family)
MSGRRSVFFVSDRTGITAESLGTTLLTQFPGIDFVKHTLPFIDSPEKADSARQEIDRAALADNARPLIISTLADPHVREVVAAANGILLDLFEAFVGRLQGEIGTPAHPAVGLSHGISNHLAYKHRMDAVNFSLSADDGAPVGNLGDADIILVGVSRSGKTPTCLYLAMQYGIRAANYPLTPEDFETLHLPKPLHAHRDKLFGLTIDPERLSQIRQERKPGSRYAALDNCRFEVSKAEKLFQVERIKSLDTTTKSVEEIATTMLHEMHLSDARHR